MNMYFCKTDLTEVVDPTISGQAQLQLVNVVLLMLSKWPWWAHPDN